MVLECVKQGVSPQVLHIVVHADLTIRKVAGDE